MIPPEIRGRMYSAMHSERVTPSLPQATDELIQNTITGKVDRVKQRLENPLLRFYYPKSRLLLSVSFDNEPAGLLGVSDKPIAVAGSMRILELALQVMASYGVDPDTSILLNEEVSPNYGIVSETREYRSQTMPSLVFNREDRYLLETREPLSTSLYVGQK